MFWFFQNLPSKSYFHNNPALPANISTPLKRIKQWNHKQFLAINVPGGVMSARPEYGFVEPYEIRRHPKIKGDLCMRSAKRIIYGRERTMNGKDPNVVERNKNRNK